MAKNILAWSEAAGQFYREIGKKENGKSVRIYLGHDEKIARANITRLEALWDAVEHAGKNRKPAGITDDPFPCWDDVTLTLARAIGKGEWTVIVEPPDDDPQGTASGSPPSALASR